MSELALIDLKQVKHGQQFLTSVDNAVEKSAVITEASEVPSDELIPAETYVNAKLDELAESMLKKAETQLDVTGDVTTEFVLQQIPSSEPVKVIVNGVEYNEGKDFTVDRTTGKIAWGGDFQLTHDTVDSIKAVYTTAAQPKSSFPKAKHIVGMVLAEEGSHNSPTFRYEPQAEYESIVYGDEVYTYHTAKGDWRRIDKNYNEVDFDPEHGTWAGIQEVTTNLDGALKYFIEIPTTWVKNEVIQSGPYAGCNCWWIADGEAPGFHVHPAFIKPDGTPGKLRIGKYMATFPENADTNVSASVNVDNIYYDFQTSSYNDLRAKAFAYNTTEESGYRAYSIYDHHFIARMILAEFGNPNVFFYQDYRTDEWYEHAGVQGIKMENPPSEAQLLISKNYHGIQNLLGDSYASCLFDGVTTLNGTYQLLAADGSGTMVETGVPCPQKGTWLTNCYMTKVNGVDFGDVFINDGRNAISDANMGQDPYVQNNPFGNSDIVVMDPNTNYTTEDHYITMKNGSFCDYQYILPNRALYTQHEDEYTYCGIFMLNSIDIDDEGGYGNYMCWRLVQVV